MTTLLESLPKDRITLFEIRFDTPDGNLSPNGFAARYALKVKGIPFHTHFLELKDVQSTCSQIGAEPTLFPSNGFPPIYTLPIIYDPNSQSLISDSYNIALWLDSHYSHPAPQLVPKGTQSLHRAFRSIHTTLEKPLLPLIIPSTLPQVPLDSQPYFRQTREWHFKMKLEDVLPTEEAKRALWEGDIKKLFDAVDGWYPSGDEEGPFMGGAEPYFADLVILGRVWWIGTVLGRETQYWSELMSWNGGRWKALLELLESRYN